MKATKFVPQKLSVADRKAGIVAKWNALRGDMEFFPYCGYVQVRNGGVCFGTTGELPPKILWDLAVFTNNLEAEYQTNDYAEQITNDLEAFSKQEVSHARTDSDPRLTDTVLLDSVPLHGLSGAAAGSV